MQQKLYQAFLMVFASQFFAFCTNNLEGQNLVPNPSFEDTISCPYNGSIDLAAGWNNAGDSPDYFNSCCGSQSPDFSVPYNWGGYQPAATGNAYCAVGVYGSHYPEAREFITAQLISPLTIGKKYTVSFKANLSLRDTMYFNTAANKLGALFSTVPYNISNPPPIANFAHIYSSTIITDTANWTTISGSFISDSLYNYIVIGNFFDDTNTDTLIFKKDTFSQTAYYYVDDVSVILDTTNEISQDELSQQIKVVKRIDGTIEILSSSSLTITVSFYNLMGQTIIQKTIVPFGNYSFKLSEKSSGIYLIQIKNQQLVTTKKIFFEKFHN